MPTFGNERLPLTKECGWKDGDIGGPAQTQNPSGEKRKPDLTRTGLLGRTYPAQMGDYFRLRCHPPPRTAKVLYSS
jgi:hypothetical protein